MPLNKIKLKKDIKSLLADMRNRTEVSDDELALRLSDAIDTYVKTATIKYVSGLTAPNGPVSGIFNGNLE